MAILENFDESLLVDNAASCSIDQYAALLHRPELLVAEEVFGIGI